MEPLNKVGGFLGTLTQSFFFLPPSFLLLLEQPPNTVLKIPKSYEQINIHIVNLMWLTEHL